MTQNSLEQFLETYPPEIRALALAARELVLGSLPGALEIVDPPSKIIAYGFSPRYADLVCAVAPYNKYVNLIFSMGTALPDPQNLLEGTGKRARHIKIQPGFDFSAPGVRALLEEALARVRP